MNLYLLLTLFNIYLTDRVVDINSQNVCGCNVCPCNVRVVTSIVPTVLEVTDVLTVSVTEKPIKTVEHTKTVFSDRTIIQQSVETKVNIQTLATTVREKELCTVTVQERIKSIIFESKTTSGCETVVVEKEDCEECQNVRESKVNNEEVDEKVDEKQNAEVDEEDELWKRINKIFQKKQLQAREAKDYQDNSDALLLPVKYKLYNNPSMLDLFEKEKSLTEVHIASKKYHSKENCYIISLKPNATETIKKYFSELAPLLKMQIRKTYLRALNGLCICFNNAQVPIEILEKIGWIDLIERETVVQQSQIQDNAPWHLDRLSGESLPLDSKFLFNSGGKNVNVYVIDSGIDTKHESFKGRASLIWSNFRNIDEDCSGHGTTVSSLIGGNNVGVAKLVNLMGLQILDCNGQGTISGVLSAIEEIMNVAGKNAVVNMSLSGARSNSLNNAIDIASKRGLIFVAASGNQGDDACFYSPGSAASVISIGSTNIDDQVSDFSNYGECVDLFAPGEQVIGAMANTKSDYSIGSGTSLSSPLVAGVVALMLEQNPTLNTASARSMLNAIAAKGKLSVSELRGSPNLVLQSIEASNADTVFVVDIDPISDPKSGPGGGSRSSGHSDTDWVWIGLGILGVILIVIAVILFLNRKRQ